MNYLEELENESIYIIREVVAECRRPVLLYSIGKDSSVLLRLAMKAFYPGKIPFPLLHIDTGFKFKEMIEFRDMIARKHNLDLIVFQNREEVAEKLTADEAHTDNYIFLKKTKPLLEALRVNRFDAAFGGSRREEEKSRAKERVFSVRDKNGVWDPKNQRPELWNLFNSKIPENYSLRIFPLSNWTELDIWAYIEKEKIEVVPLYFSQKRRVVKRHNLYFRLDEFVKPKAGERVLEIDCRYRTLGCSPSTGAIPSKAKTVREIIDELLRVENSERETRVIDYGSDSAMEQKKREGYF